MTNKKNLKSRIRELQEELAELQSKLTDNSEFKSMSTELLGITDKRLLKALPDMIFVLDKKGYFVDYYASDFSKLIASPDKISNYKLEEVLPDFLVKLTREKMKLVFDSGLTHTYNYSIDLDGKSEYYESRMIPFDGDRVLAVVKNVTDSFHSLMQAGQQRDFLLRILNTSPVGIIQLDKEGKLLFMNREVRKRFGLEAVEYGKCCPFCHIIIESKYQSFKAFLVTLKQAKENKVSYQTEISFNSDQSFTIIVRAMLSKNPVSGEEEVFLYVENISALTESQKMLSEHIEKLALSQEIGRIAYWEFSVDDDRLSGFEEFIKHLSVDIEPSLSSTEFLEHVHPEDHGRISLLFADNIGCLKGITEQFRLIVNDDIVWVEIHTQKQENPVPGEKLVIKGSIQDITKQKLQEEKLYENQKLLDVLMERLPVAVYVKDAGSKRYRFWNKAAEDLFGHSKKEVLGRQDKDIFSYKLASFLEERDEQSLESGVALEYIEEEFEKDGELKYLNSYQVPIAMHGKYEAILGISIDITEKKLVEQDLIAAKDQAVKSDGLKSSFLANMSHEIRNPMNSIVGFSKILVEEENLSQEEKTEFIELINTNAKQLLRLISDIIDIAKIENNKLKIFKQNVSVNALMDRLNAMYVRNLEETGKNKIEVTLKKSLPDSDCLIFTDEQRFLQIFNNLLSNAVRFTEQGEIEFGYIQKNLFELEFFVRDTGKGISDSDMQSIFIKFNQGSDLKNHVGGTGLGLSITQELVKYLGGKIWVDSQLGKGTCFRFTLPRESKKLNTKNTLADTAEKDITTDWEKHKILIVDDNPDVQSFVKILLKKTGVQVFTANNGKEAVEYTESVNGDIDIILMDIQMPVMNGVNAMRIIRNRYPGIAVFAQTAFALEGDEEKFKEEGFVDYISKPINKKSLISKLSTVFARK